VTLGGAACAVKLTPETEALLMFSSAVEGVNVYPERLGATTYEPLLRPLKLYPPAASVVVDAAAVPDNVTIVAGALTVPEIFQPSAAAVKLAVAWAPLIVTVPVIGVKMTPAFAGVMVYVPFASPAKL
jgi:hypothetical protein